MRKATLRPATVCLCLVWAQSFCLQSCAWRRFEIPLQVQKFLLISLNAGLGRLLIPHNIHESIKPYSTNPEAWMRETQCEQYWQRIWKGKRSLVPTIQNSHVLRAQLESAQRLVVAKDGCQAAGLTQFCGTFLTPSSGMKARPLLNSRTSWSKLLGGDVNLALGHDAPELLRLFHTYSSYGKALVRQSVPWAVSKSNWKRTLGHSMMRQ